LAATIDSVEVMYGVTLPVASTLTSFGVSLHQQLTFDDHATAVAFEDLSDQPRFECVAQTSAFSLINSRLNYLNSLMYGAPETTADSTPRAQNNASHVALAAYRHSDATPLLYEHGQP